MTRVFIFSSEEKALECLASWGLPGMVEPYGDGWRLYIMEPLDYSGDN